MRHGKNGEAGADGIFALKRFKDGSYYEDFFIDKVCKTLTDYGMTGIHMADTFCPATGKMIHSLDFSTDFVGQFIDHTKITLPDEIAETMGNDDKASEELRGNWIYRNLRAEWARFVVWRWEVFFTKLCTRLHAIGKKVSVLAMYCTDPFETVYCLGIDLKRIVAAGVDRVTANILPTSVYFGGPDGREYYFHKYMAIAPTTAAHLPKGKLISMVGVHDPTEEWSMIHHQPTQHERDMYTMMAYHTIDGEGIRRSLEGYMMCLGDGLSASDWQWESKRMSAATDGRVKKCLSGAMLWSENANEAMLDEFIRTRRWTPHKHFYELAKKGTLLGATVTPEGLAGYEGLLLVPNIDMLTPDEQRAVAEYKGGAVLCTAMKGFDEGKIGIKASVEITDKFSNYPLRAFAFGCTVTDEMSTRLDALTAVDDGTENLPEDLLAVEEPDNTLVDTLVFSKVTDGFVTALAELAAHIMGAPFEINKPNIQLLLDNGDNRLYIFNDCMNKYHRAFVKAPSEIDDAWSVSAFPILPPRYIVPSSVQVASPLET